MKVLITISDLRNFTGNDFHGCGVGGNEAAIVCLAEAFARIGWDVTCGTAEQGFVIERNVIYCSPQELRDKKFDIAIAFRGWHPCLDEIEAESKVFFSADCPLKIGTSFLNAFNWAHCIALMSQYQKSRIEEQFQGLRGKECGVVGIPINLSDYERQSEIREHKILYCSAPDRGLYYHQKIYPAVKKKVNDAILNVTFDYSLWARAPGNEDFVQMFNGIEGVKMKGALSRKDLVTIQKSSKVLAYPCIFEEGFCLAAAECMAAGVVPVSTDAFALSETVGDAGILIPGHPSQFFYRLRFVREVVRLLNNNPYWLQRSNEVRDIAFKKFGGEGVIERLLRLISKSRSLGAV
jgi:hypothetical protein